MLFKCRWCLKEEDVPVTQEQYDSWSAGRASGGAYIQDALPFLTPEQRELILTQTCGRCFDETFGDPDDADV